ncbi:dihydropterin pyrophosphokinase [Actinidia rufa]|uniref:2-amino-4-hydroxy-6-hydroxymethyldihydropteridine diphosphokinase n=1 Tax=Actinidia rufa TaxID=165716 RepID=A0A7J0HAS4_9ERIC|nr:dihydropterin pyrophosphokinase [Actinidia rufa]
MAACSSLFHSSTDTSVEVHTQEQEVVIALGSNVGDKLHNFNEALQLMSKLGVKRCYKAWPHEPLGVLKKIEKGLGRTAGIRYGPRTIDLDILFYGNYKIHSEILTVPHERIWERPFVVAPLTDLIGSSVDSDTVACWHALSGHSGGLFESWEKLDGADIIDLGAQSTRPIASRISVEEELDRFIPVLEAVQKMPRLKGNFYLWILFIQSNAHEGDPSTMQSSENLQYDNVCKQVASELYSRVRAAELLVERDPATVASVTAGVLGGANIVRVHNIRENMGAVKLCDAMLKRRSLA